jgi:UDP-galactopyranose mutase
MIIISKHIVPKEYLGIAIFPFVFLKDKALKVDGILINHENIHLRQQIELLIVPFYILYGLEFLVRLFQYKKGELAYRNISFEREAFTNEFNLNYLKQRPFWQFLKYLRKDDF